MRSACVVRTRVILNILVGLDWGSQDLQDPPPLGYAPTHIRHSTKFTINHLHCSRSPFIHCEVYNTQRNCSTLVVFHEFVRYILTICCHVVVYVVPCYNVSSKLFNG